MQANRRRDLAKQMRRWLDLALAELLLHIPPAPEGLFQSITASQAYQDKSFEELRWERYSKGDVLEAQPPAEPPAAAQPAPPSQQPSIRFMPSVGCHVFRLIRILRTVVVLSINSGSS